MVKRPLSLASSSGIDDSTSRSRVAATEHPSVNSQQTEDEIRLRNMLGRCVRSCSGRISLYINECIEYNGTATKRINDVDEESGRTLSEMVDCYERVLESPELKFNNLDIIHQIFSEYEKELMNVCENSIGILGFFIDNDDTHAPNYLIAQQRLTVQQRLSLLQEYGEHHSEEDVVSYIRALFPAIAQPDTSHTAGKSTEHPSGIPPLPRVAPEKYAGLRGPETPPDFIKRVYAPWVGSGLDRAVLRKLDPALMQSLYNWLRKNEMPDDLHLPTRSESVSRMIDEIRAEATDGNINPVVGEFTAREAARIRSAIQRREK